MNDHVMDMGPAGDAIGTHLKRIAELEADLASETKSSGYWFAWHVRAAEEDNEIIEEWQERAKQAEANYKIAERQIEVLEAALKTERQCCDEHIRQKEKAEAKRDAALDVCQELTNLVGNIRDILGMYLEPGDLRIQTEHDCVNALFEEMDSPKHKKMRDGVKALLAKHEGKDEE